MAMHILRGMAAGLAAGAAASWIMHEFQSAGAQRPQERSQSERRQTQEEEPVHQQEPLHQSDDLDENATVKAAVAVSRKVLHHELTGKEKQIAGPAVHYAYGSVVGALYGGLAELLPITSAGLGMPFGFALWLLGDEIAVPALGLGKGPTEYPAEAHADALAAHFVYGATTDILRRVLKHVL